MRRPLQVVLIDDNPAEILLAEESFAAFDHPTTLTGYLTGMSAIEAMQQPDAVLPDVILLDINMPEMTGFEVLNLLKADARLRLIPVVMLATSGEAHDVSAAYALYASSYMMKVPSFAAFVEQMDVFIRYWMTVRVVQRFL
ncbi:response regulator [Deinococcus psychrotolerans]|uniref:Response regulator n=1 Tax=Deinococcus psychrotolerans TaxID=2489213 RepID=A0A3G8YFG1_9DEIO|nr:response regulator [Deinococcus psychrotolerans]AZI44069.1 response regulator [Deinococcus psychrotolerans]